MGIPFEVEMNLLTDDDCYMELISQRKWVIYSMKVGHVLRHVISTPRVPARDIPCLSLIKFFKALGFITYNTILYVV